LKQAAAAAVEGEVPIGAVVVRKVMDNLSHLNLNLSNQTTIHPEHPEHVYFVLSVARNAVEATHDASAHAELLALRATATNQQPLNWRLNVNGTVNGDVNGQQPTATTTLSFTLEPCPMCLSAAQAFVRTTTDWKRSRRTCDSCKITGIPFTTLRPLRQVCKPRSLRKCCEHFFGNDDWKKIRTCNCETSNSKVRMELE
jgi:tRNA(Arg) A34 adenosine deaminase TadA